MLYTNNAIKVFTFSKPINFSRSCFPTTIITRVLMSGLKDYYQHGGKPGEGHMSSDDKMPKMASAVGILGHLASKHGQDIRNALMKLFEVIDLIGLLRYCLCSKLFYAYILPCREQEKNLL